MHCLKVRIRSDSGGKVVNILGGDTTVMAGGDTAVMAGGDTMFMARKNSRMNM
jgi:hypothetical protein